MAAGLTTMVFVIRMIAKFGADHQVAVWKLVLAICKQKRHQLCWPIDFKANRILTRIDIILNQVHLRVHVPFGGGRDVALVRVTRPERCRPLGIQTILTLLHLPLLQIRLQALDHTTLVALIARLRALCPLGCMPLRRTLLDIGQFAVAALLRFLGCLAFPFRHYHLVPDTIDGPRPSQVKAVAGTRVPRTRKPFADRALVLPGALPAGVGREPLVAAVCRGRRAVTENRSMLNARATLDATPATPVRC